MGRFIIKKLNEGIQFFLAAGNREVIAASAKYNSKASCMKGISSVVRNAPVASVEDKTCRKSEKEINPKFEIFKDEDGLFRFVLRAKNGQTVISSEGYKAKASCKNGIESVKKNASNSEIVDMCL